MCRAAMHRTMKHMILRKRMVIVPVAIFALTGMGGGGYVVKHNHDVEEARQARAAAAERAHRAEVGKYERDMAAWREESTAHADCDAASADAFAAHDSFDGQLTAGLSYEEYTSGLAGFTSSVRAASRDDACPEVSLALTRAVTAYAEAAGLWREWKEDLYDTRDLDDVPLQPHWDDATEAILDAEAALDDMEPGDAPVRPARGERYRPPSSASEPLPGAPDPETDDDPLTGEQTIS
jgi:hypothetical protein